MSWLGGSIRKRIKSPEWKCPPTDIWTFDSFSPCLGIVTKLSILRRTSIFWLFLGIRANCPMTVCRRFSTWFGLSPLCVVLIEMVKNQVPSLLTLKAYWLRSRTLEHLTWGNGLDHFNFLTWDYGSWTFKCVKVRLWSMNISIF